jgi:hypothetical protein
LHAYLFAFFGSLLSRSLSLEESGSEEWPEPPPPRPFDVAGAEYLESWLSCIAVAATEGLNVLSAGTARDWSAAIWTAALAFKFAKSAAVKPPSAPARYASTQA